MHKRNLAARAGRWSAQHRKTAILGWILFVLVANGESRRADMIVDAADFPDQAGEQVLVQGKAPPRRTILGSPPPSRTSSPGSSGSRA